MLRELPGIVLIAFARRLTVILVVPLTLILYQEDGKPKVAQEVMAMYASSSAPESAWSAQFLVAQDEGGSVQVDADRALLLQNSGSHSFGTEAESACGSIVEVAELAITRSRSSCRRLSRMDASVM
jgi:hypothetical protein